ncbi:MAG: toprim domain-containing protein [candidate division Zixibacteria bacterium]|nr:toprim domain-containing protein [candidate division Zixibacteria bacterium]
MQDLDAFLRSLEEKVVVVEGKHDVDALHALGVRPRLVEAVGKTEQVVRRVLELSRGEPKSVVLLFDYDGEGERKNEEFECLFNCEGFGSVLDRLPRKRLKAFLGLRTIEEIVAKYDEYKVKQNG